MPHLDHDRLVFLALGETEADAGENTHLDTCAHCRAEMETLQHVAGLGADAQGLHDLPDPPEHVWQGIVTEIRAAQTLPALPGPRAERSPDERPSGERPSERSGGVLLAPRRGRWSRWAVTAATAVAAAAIGVVGTVAVLDATGSTPEPAPRRVVLASAPLKAYGETPPDANGEARVFDDGRLHLHVANLPDVPGYYEVWLIDPRTMKMFSVGVLGDATDELLPLPPNVDLEAYSVVDVSAETYDNNTAHSGKSLVRGTLTG
ncbi:anti-sigma factor [Micromonospora sp. DSM 115977]|uniref:Anti-sigma factor n=1 Tax=Micromonospora reichwaldensis TaxID=3075516 RepID=A0ABU2X3V9_9ACTN|nr:anti-sigma factor [Micromonospora sp. DSM 115977]MDT0532885.1 anti-sigma factor [Micromonospora sp. DSM 115977]